MSSLHTSWDYAQQVKCRTEFFYSDTWHQVEEFSLGIFLSNN